MSDKCENCKYKRGTLFSVGDRVIVLDIAGYEKKGEIISIADSRTNTDPWYLVRTGLFTKEWKEWNFLRKIRA